MVTVVVVGAPSDVRGPGDWLHQYRGNGKTHFDAGQLDCYLAIVSAMSTVFDEVLALSTSDDAVAVLFPPPGSPAEVQLDRQLLTSWLNFANGALGLADLIDTDGDGVPDTSFGDVISAAEAARLDPTATNAQLEAHKDLLELIND